MQQTNHIGQQLKEKLTQAIATGKLQVKKAERPAPLNAAKKEEPTKALQQAISICSRIEAVQGTIPVDQTLRRLESIRHIVHPFGIPIKDERGAKVTQLRRSAETCQNYIATVATGIRNNDLEAEHLPGVVVKMTGMIRDVIACVKAYHAGGTDKPQLNEELTEAKLQRFAASKQRLVSRIIKSNRVTAFATMPVLAIFEPAVRTIDLFDAGLPVEGYDGLYSIVTDQQVVGVTNDTARGDPKELLAKAIASISKAKRKNYSLVSDQPVGVNKYGMKFYWIADARTLAVLDNVKGNHIQVAKWSFPF